MQKISGAGHVNNRFVHENINTGQEPTEITADWMNAVQDELVAIVAEAGIALDVNNNAQVLAALYMIFQQKITQGHGGNFNADMLDGYHASSFQPAGNYQPLITQGHTGGFNADMLDGYHASSFQPAGNYQPLITQGHTGGFNADMLDGYHASDFLLSSEKVIFKAVKTNGSNQTIPSSTNTKLTGWVAEIDTHSGLAGDAFTVSVPGIYEFNLLALCSPNQVSSGAFRVLIYKNGVSIKTAIFRFAGNTTTSAICQTIINMSVNDYIEVYAWQDTGDWQPVAGESIFTEFSGKLL